MILHSLRHTAAAALTLAAMALAACSSEAPSPAASEETRGDVTLRLKVSTDGAGTTSRADLGDQDGYEPGTTGFESVATLRVIILRPDGKTIEANRMVHMDADMRPLNDNLEFSVESNELKYVYLIANESALPIPADIQGYDSTGEWLDTFTKGKEYTDITTVLANWTAGFDAATVAKESLFAKAGRLPMTEMFRVQTIKKLSDAGAPTPTPGTPGQIAVQVQEARLFLTRAAAKATFRFDFSNYPDNVSGVQVTAVRLNGLSQMEYVFPNTTVYSPGKYVGGNEDKGEVNSVPDNERYITSFASPEVNSIMDFLFDGDAGFAPVDMKKPAGASETDKKLIVRGPIYFPESLSAKDTKAYEVEVQLDGGDWLTAKPLTTNILEFTDKGGVKHQAISRNTHLYIDIKFTPTGITWQAIEAPYNTVTLDPIFGLGPNISDR